MWVFLFFSQKLSFFSFLVHICFLYVNMSLRLQGNLRKINIERVKKTFEILSHFGVLVSGNCNARLI